MRDDIPLQTPMGSYNPSWLRRNRTWIVLIAVVAIAMYLGAVVVTRLGRPEPTSLDTQVFVSDDLRIKASPGNLHHAVNLKNQPVSKEFELKNNSDSPIRLKLTLRTRGTDYRQVNPDLALWSSADPSAVIAPGHDELQNFRADLEVFDGVSPDGSIGPKTTAKMRLTYTNLGESREGVLAMLLLVSPVP